ncbi:phosphotransferase [Actinosynnema sp. NPDC023587]|uniref:phosphotransferase n=1 Tax=Actinosynnema sp. NPDC023587 TaxID=3154695 RepID=UPI0033C262EC
MRDLPPGLTGEQVRDGLAAFGIRARSVAHAAVGFGDHHWVADRRWFATVADLTRKPHCGTGAVAALAGLRAAMGTAVALGDELDFVVPPRLSLDGDPVVPLDERYALSVFPFTEGEPGEFGRVPTADERDRLLDLLARLHASAVPAPPVEVAVDGRAALESALTRLDRPWTGGPHAEDARRLLSARAGVVRDGLAEFDRLAGLVRGRPVVVTHGEPHPGNLIATDSGYRLVDWDTVRAAVPERDLSVVAAGPGPAGDLGRYAEITGHVPDVAALSLYRLRWSLVDVAEFASWFHGPHEASEDTSAAWRGLVSTLDDL